MDDLVALVAGGRGALAGDNCGTPIELLFTHQALEVATFMILHQGSISSLSLA